MDHEFTINTDENPVVITRDDGEVFLLKRDKEGNSALYTQISGEGSGIQIDRNIPDQIGHAQRYADNFSRDADGKELW